MAQGWANGVPQIRSPKGYGPCHVAIERQEQRRSRHRRGSLGDERGSAAAELVIATPLLLLLIMGIVQFALWEHATHVAEAVAQQGLSVGRLQGSSAAAGKAEAQTVFDQLGRGVLISSDITASRNATNTTVVVTGHAESVIGLFSLPVRAVASGPTEPAVNAVNTP
jgi:Flp pilus assembly protein TadG